MAGISTWVFLYPLPESPEGGIGTNYSEPYKGDYIAWAKAIARLSVRYSNLVGYVIDDFWFNTPYDSTSAAGQRSNKFSPGYIYSMVNAGKNINPNLKFYPLMYFYQIDFPFIINIGPLVDGVVGAYPGQVDDKGLSDSLSIINVLNLLNNTKQIIIENLGTNSKSEVGNFGLVFKNIEVTNPSSAFIRIYHYTDRGDVDWAPVGYQSLQLKIDSEAIWKQDIVDSNGISTINLTNALTNKSNCKLSLGIFTERHISSYSVNAEFWVDSIQGFHFTNMDWVEESDSNYAINYFQPSKNLPLLVMPAAEIDAYSNVYTD